jgi:hypothetical protein
VKAKLAIGVLVVLGLVLAVGIVFLVAEPDPVMTEGDATTVLIAFVRVPVADSEPVVRSPDQFLGIPTSPPTFDTSAYGPDLNFQQQPTELKALDPDKVLRAVYLGHDPSGQPYYIWQKGSQNLFEVISQLVADLGSVGRYMTSYGTERSGPGIFNGDSIPEEGQLEGSMLSQTDHPTILVAEWHALPPDVALVALYDGTTPLGWQAPVSGTAAFRFEYLEEDPFSDITMTALDRQGEVWHQQLVFPAQIDRSGPQPQR